MDGGADLTFGSVEETADVGVVTCDGENGEDGADEDESAIVGRQECHGEGECCGGEDAGQRDVTGYGEDESERTESGEEGQGGPCGEDTGGRGDPFAALESEPAGEVVTEDGCDAGEEGEGGGIRFGWCEKARQEEDREGSFGGIGEEDEDAEALAQDAEHVGRADVAGAHTADVHTPGPGDQKPGGNGAAQVGGQGHESAGDRRHV